ncbi:hypothetical protein VE00_04681 [Pseudogymnoascus sp. WSF 3629]|nr:hypothetical protein VE00_04681 [Pseudogymnoascus sp. WSF 3629]
MTTHGMHSRLCREAQPALAIMVPRHSEWDGPAEAARGGELEAEVVVKACDGVVVLVDYEEVAAGCEIAVVEAVEGVGGKRGRGKLREIGGVLEVRDLIIFDAFRGGGRGVFLGAAWTLPLVGSIFLAEFSPAGSRW